MYFDVCGSFGLFLALTINVAAPGLLSYARKITVVPQKRSGQAREGHNTFLILQVVVIKAGGSEVVFVHSSQKGIQHVAVDA